MREVIPYFRRASILSSVGWDFGHANASMPNGDQQPHQTEPKNPFMFANTHVAPVLSPSTAAALGGSVLSSGALMYSSSASAAATVNAMRSLDLSSENTRSVPLTLAHLTRPLAPDTSSSDSVLASLSRLYPEDVYSGRVLQIYSPNRKRSITLRAADAATIQHWMNAIQSVIYQLLAQAIIDANEQLFVDGILDGTVIRHMGWMYEMDSTGFAELNNSANSGAGAVSHWHPIFVAVTDRDLLFYDLVPWTKEAWAVPVSAVALIHCRFVPSRGFTSTSTSGAGAGGSGTLYSPSRDPLTGRRVITFALRIGTLLGVEVRVLRCETHRDLANWSQSIRDGIYRAVVHTREIQFSKFAFFSSPRRC